MRFFFGICGPAFGRFRRFRKVEKADSHVSGEAKVDHLLLATISLTVFIRRVPVEDNTASACIHTVATYGIRIRRERHVRIRCELRVILREYQFMPHKRKLITGLRYFCISLNSRCFKIKVITRNIMFFNQDKTIDRTSYFVSVDSYV